MMMTSHKIKWITETRCTAPLAMKKYRLEDVAVIISRGPNRTQIGNFKVALQVYSFFFFKAVLQLHHMSGELKNLKAIKHNLVFNCGQ
jgi:hypothetical protein